jgi:WD40 repeat protein
MKIKSLFLAVLLVVSSVASFAGKDEPRKTGLAVVRVKGSEVFKVIYKAEVAGKIKLSIYNAAGSLVFSETISGLDGFIYPVNFKGLTSGDYTIEILDAAGKRVEKVSYQTAKKGSTFHVSKLSEDGKFLVSVGSKTEEKVNIRIYDSKNNQIYDETKVITGDFAQVYKLLNSSTGYTFELSDNAGNFERVVF